MADLDLAELRRLAEAARERELPWAPPFTIEESLYLSAVPPAVVLQLLDRLEAAEARPGAVARHEVRRALHASNFYEQYDALDIATNAVMALLAPSPAVPGAVAGEPGGEQQ